MKTPQRLVLVTLVAAFFSLALAAQESAPAPIPGLDGKPVQAPRTLGSQSFQIDLGGMIPLFTVNSDGNELTPGGNMGGGGVGHLRWGAFLNQFISLGVDVSGSIIAGPNSMTTGNTVGIFNIGPQVSSFFRLGNFQVPVSFMPAFSILSYGGASYAGFALKPSVGLYYDFTANWSFGINIDYWWVPELYAGPTPPSTQNRFGNLLEISLSALYSF